MYQRNKKHEYCVICGTHVLKEIAIKNFFFKQKGVCPHCLKEFEEAFIKEQSRGIEVFYIYWYNDFFRSLLYQFKGLYDIALKDVFLLKYRNYIQRKYSGYVIAIAPSYMEENRIRKFIPLLEIVTQLNMPVFLGLYKKSNHKQAIKRWKERQEIKKIIGIHNGEELYHKKVLFIDDVVTSGNTMEACIDLINKSDVSDIKVLILAKNKRREHEEDEGDC